MTDIERMIKDQTVNKTRVGDIIIRLPDLAKAIEQHIKDNYISKDKDLIKLFRTWSKGLK